MKLIGLTGGIGSGKSTVAKMLEELGIPLYNSDLRARNIMNENHTIISNLKEWYGENIYINGVLDRKKLGERVFANQEELTRLNKLVHPIVAQDFAHWKNSQKTDFILKEAAILFETEGDKDCDIIVTVSAPLDQRIKRTIERDNSTEKLVKDRISKQWTDKQREEKSDYIIHNNSTLENLKKQVQEFYLKITN